MTFSINIIVLKVILMIYLVGVAKMLIQSHSGCIELLPVLPGAWSEGSVSGVYAHGGFVISMDWTGRVLKTVTVWAKNSGRGTLVSGENEKR
jgi:alpha-L-fucosidase 2